MPSTRSSFRGRTSEQGYVLISAIALAILYFALMELMLIDSSRALREAQRFRSRIMASTLAENAAELAGAKMVTSAGTIINAEDDQGRMKGTYHRNESDGTFELNGQAETTGVAPVSATVKVQGRIVDGHISVDYTYHSQ